MEEVGFAGDLTKWPRLCCVIHLLDEPKIRPKKEFFIENDFYACMMFDLVEFSKKQNPNHPLTTKWIIEGLNYNYYSIISGLDLLANRSMQDRNFSALKLHLKYRISVA